MIKGKGDSMNILVLSDIHLGHRKTKTETIIYNLNRFFAYYTRVIKRLDLIVLSGDIYDRLVEHGSRESIEISNWLLNLVKLCTNNNIKLRILEGTFTHDRHQIRLLESVIDRENFSIDFRYHESIDIEEIDGFNFLFVPDDIHEDGTDVYRDVLKKLKEKDLSKVDVAVMHGAFTFQLPVEINSSHNPDDYLEIVDKFIVIGHVHNGLKRGKIHVPGSFDRLRYGEEEEKGCLHFILTKEGYDYKFIPNIFAQPYIRFLIDEENIEESVREIRTIVKDIDYGYLQLRGYDAELLDEIRKKIKSGKVHIEIDVIKEKVEKITFTTNMDIPIIDKETIETMIMSRVDEEKKEVVKKLIKEIR